MGCHARLRDSLPQRARTSDGTGARHTSTIDGLIKPARFAVHIVRVAGYYLVRLLARIPETQDRYKKRPPSFLTGAATVCHKTLAGCCSRRVWPIMLMHA